MKMAYEKRHISGFHILRFLTTTCVLLFMSIEDAYSSHSHEPEDRPCSDLRNTLQGNFNCDNYNDHGSTCRFVCSDTGYSPCRGTPTSWTCDNGDWKGINAQPSCCDTRAPSITCPSSQTVYAGRNNEFAIATWSLPKVSDNSMMAIQPVRKSGLSSGSRFDEGRNVIKYSATDAAGNTASCTFTIHVIVLRCGNLAGAPPLTISCSQSDVIGSECTYRCPLGKCVNGDISVTCDNIGNSTNPLARWSQDEQPTCHDIHCPELTPPLHSTFKIGLCRTDFDSTCVFDCDPGYTLVSGNTERRCRGSEEERTCASTPGYWTGSQPSCQDTTPPIFHQSDNQITLRVESGRTHATVDYTWEPITAVDGVSGEVTATLISIDSQMLSFTDGVKPDELPEGTYTLLYEAVDDMDNKATWSMVLHVVVTRCSEPEVIQNGQTICESTDFVIGASCTVRCNAGYCLANSSSAIVTCIGGGGSRLQNNARWDRQPICRSHSEATCSDLVAPDDGYIKPESCLSDSVGSRCEMACNSGYQLAGDNTRVCRIEVEATCDEATWSGEPTQCVVSTCSSLAEEFPAFHTGCNTAPGTDNVGASCQWHCALGYRSSGSDVSNCLADGTWDSNDFSCEEITCPALTTPPSIVLTPPSCDNQPIPTGTSCRFRCLRPGFELRDSVDETVTDSEVICDVNGEWVWKEYRTPFWCSDIEPPTFTECVRTRTYYAARSSLLADVAWNTVAIDNSGDDPVIECNVPLNVSSQLGEGVFNIRWSATDEAGNEARCDSDVTVRVRRCQPEIPDLPNHGVVDADYPCHNHYGGECRVMCEDQYELIGGSQAVCEYNGDYTYWSWGTDRPICVPKVSDECGDRLGMKDESIEDNQITASSEWDRNHGTNNARLDRPASGRRFGAWSARTNDTNQWIQVDFGKLRSVSGIVSQGRSDRDQWVTKYKVQYSDDGTAWEYVKDDRDTDMVFNGNSDRNAHKTSWFTSAINAKFIRIQPTEWHGHISMRFEILGCEADSDVGCPSFPASLFAYGVAFECSASNRIGSTCTFYCSRPGFNIPGGNVQIECQPDGTWNVDITVLQPHCLDTEPPSVSQCPSQSINTELSRDTLKAEVHFLTPHARDNSELIPRVTTIPPDVTSPYNFTTSTLVRYEFFDEAGNNATCSFQVNVQNNLQPIVTCPEDMQFDSPDDVTWQIPEFRNPITDEVIVPWCTKDNADKLGPGNHTITCTASNPDNGLEASCVFVITVAGRCNALTQPENGVLTCVDNTCTISCNRGYAVRNGQPREFTCGDRGWLPTNTVSECAVIRRPQLEIKQDVVIKYQCYGECNDDQTKTEVGAQAVTFVESVQSTGPCSDMCSSDASVTIQESALDLRRRRSSDSVIMTLCISLKAPVSETATEVDIGEETEDMTSLANAIVDNLNGFNPDVPAISFERVVEEGGVRLSDVDEVCENGYTPDIPSNSCICESNKYELNGECLPCPGDEYQTDHEGQTSCNPPPE